MTKHSIRAPRKPRGENKSVTIANQEKQIKLLLDRNEELRKESNINHGHAQSLASQLKANELDSIRKAYTRLLGWQDCAREIMMSLEMPLLKSSAPGV